MSSGLIQTLISILTEANAYVFWNNCNRKKIFFTDFIFYAALFEKNQFREK